MNIGNIKTRFTELILFLCNLFLRISEFLQDKICVRKKELRTEDTVLIVGACGAVGTELAGKIANYGNFWFESGSRLILIDKDEKLRNDVEFYKNEYKCEVHYLVEDVTNYESVLDFLKSLVDVNIIPNFIIFNAGINNKSIYETAINDKGNYQIILKIIHIFALILSGLILLKINLFYS